MTSHLAPIPNMPLLYLSQHSHREGMSALPSQPPSLSNSEFNWKISCKAEAKWTRC